MITRQVPDRPAVTGLGTVTGGPGESSARSRELVTHATPRLAGSSALEAVARVACEVHGASQHADELTDALILADAVRPEVIVEIGCDRGGTLYAWRKICLRVYGITTVDNGFASGGSGGALQHHGATVIHGDSHDPATLRTLLDLLDYHPVDVLVIDGDHHLAGVRQDFEWYGSLVRPGGLIMLHDIAVSNDPRAEVDQFWPELIRKFEPARVTEIQSRQHAPFGWGVIRA